MKMEFGKTMVARKIVIVMVALITVAGLASATSVVISNHLYGSASVKHVDYYDMTWSKQDGAPYTTETPLPVSTGGAVANVGPIYAGVWYGVGVSVYNPNTGGPTPMVKAVVSISISNLNSYSQVHTQIWLNGAWTSDLPYLGTGTYSSGSFSVPYESTYDVWAKILIDPTIGQDPADSVILIDGWLETV